MPSPARPTPGPTPDPRHEHVKALCERAPVVLVVAPDGRGGLAVEYLNPRKDA